jgi:hypothetical protein
MIQAPIGAYRQEATYPLKAMNEAASGTIIGGNGGHYDRPRPFAARHRKVVFVGSVVLTLAVVGALVGILIKRPWIHNDNSHITNGGHRNAQDHYNNGKQGKDGSIGGDNADGTPVRFTESSSVSISSSVRCNDYTPPLDQPFQYGQQPLGGWLVLEPYITPSIFTPRRTPRTNTR